MARVPFIGRLFIREYFVLCLSFLFLAFEFIIRIITIALPNPVIQFCYNRSRAVFRALPSTKRNKTDKKSQNTIVRKIRNADGFVEMCALFGYQAEEHIVQTKDGYLLGLHRIPRGKNEAPPKRGEKHKEKKRGVVYLHHGLMMNSEVWVCNLEAHKCIPFVLAEKGFDVWLGNNRGNKYSKKSIYTNSQDAAFWNFSMDEFAMHDIPDSISYILATTKSPSLSYIGFSQGTAQAFAALSIHPDLNEVVDVFIALAPAMSPAGLYNPIVDALVKASPDVIFLFFGRKSILSSTMFWQSILYPPIFVGVIDKSLTFLFNWTGKNMTIQQKLAAYAHLFSFTSVKSVVHWFQIIRTKSFQMYDDDVQAPIGWGYGRSFYKVAKFPTRNITTPVCLVYGGSDSLVDISVMLAELPAHTTAQEVPHYEHLDFLWGDEVDKLVIPHVLESLELHSTGTSKGDLIEEGKPPIGKQLRFSNPELPSYSEDERNTANESSDNQSSLPTDDALDHLNSTTPTTPPNERSSTADSTPKPSPKEGKQSRTPTPPLGSTSSAGGIPTPAWPTWLGGKARSGSTTSSTPSLSDKDKEKTTPGGLTFGENGLRLGVSKPAPTGIVTDTMGEGEDFEPKRRRKTKAANR